MVMGRANSGTVRGLLAACAALALAVAVGIASPAQAQTAPAPASVAPAVDADTSYMAIEPQRLVDTRTSGALRPGQVLEVNIPEMATTAVPDDVQAASLNLTATRGAAPGWLRVFPCGAPQPSTSAVNFLANQDVANAAVADLAKGSTCITTSQQVHVVVDLMGWFPGTARGLHPIVPDRVYDSREGGKPLKGGVTREVQITGTGESQLPSAATAVVLNVTVTEPIAGGWLAVFPCGESLPGTSNLNFAPMQSVPNMVITRLGDAGRVCVRSLVDTHVIVDVGGWFDSESAVSTVRPERLFDSRPAGAGTAFQVQVTGGSVPVDAAAVILNVTAVTPSRPGWAKAFPCGSPEPGTSNLNFAAGQDVPNAVVSKVGTDGRVCFATLVPAHLVVDIMGFIGKGADGIDPAVVDLGHTPVSGGTTAAEVDQGVTLSADFPDSSSDWRFDLLRQNSDGSWGSIGKHSTTGGSDNWRLTLPYGNYSIFAPPQNGTAGYPGAGSQPGVVSAAAPTITGSQYFQHTCAVEYGSGEAIDVYVNLGGNVDRAADVQVALDRLAAVSPVAFNYRGTTSATRLDNALVIVILPSTSKSTTGVAGTSVQYEVSGEEIVGYNYQMYVEIQAGFHNSASASLYQALIWHEVAHTLGAEHSERATDLLYSTISAVNSAPTLWDIEQVERYPSQPCQVLG